MVKTPGALDRGCPVPTLLNLTAAGTHYPRTEMSERTISSHAKKKNEQASPWLIIVQVPSVEFLRLGASPRYRVPNINSTTDPSPFFQPPCAALSLFPPRRGDLDTEGETIGLGDAMEEGVEVGRGRGVDLVEVASSLESRRRLASKG